MIYYEGEWDYRGCHMKDHGCNSQKQVQLQKGEFITKVSGTFKDIIISLGIETNMGQNLSENDPGIPLDIPLQSFSFQGHRLMYISGRSRDIIHALRFHFDECNNP